MEQKYKTSTFKKLLDRLQEDSWQLELLISGFAIFGLFYAIEPLYNLGGKANFNGNQISIIFYSILLVSIYILIFNLLLHVVLRGLWIGSLGLRYVSGDIDLDKLNYSAQFTKYLKKKVGSFDAYISKLENICSVIFAISFLLVFYILAIFIMGFIIYYIMEATKSFGIPWLSIGFLILFGIGIFLTFFDFITQGLLKKNKWVSKVYFPFYWVFSIFTLSFLYRPLVYNFLDNKFGKRVSMAVLPFYLLIGFISSLDYQKSNFITLFNSIPSSIYFANGENYGDVIKINPDLFIDKFSIQSKVITESYIKVTIPLSHSIEDSLVAFNPSLKLKEDKRGLRSSFRIGFSRAKDNPNEDSLISLYLNTFEKYYSFKIDSLLYKTEFVIATNEEEVEFESYIDIKDLPVGKHIIAFQRLKGKGTDSIESILKVPFWHFRE